jgi:hypothetical protein
MIELHKKIHDSLKNTQINPQKLHFKKKSTSTLRASENYTDLWRDSTKRQHCVIGLSCQAIDANLCSPLREIFKAAHK